MITVVSALAIIVEDCWGVAAYWKFNDVSHIEVCLILYLLFKFNKMDFFANNQTYECFFAAGWGDQFMFIFPGLV